MTYARDFTFPGLTPITVAYRVVDNGDETTTISILDVYPNAEEYQRLSAASRQLREMLTHERAVHGVVAWWFLCLIIYLLDRKVRREERRVQLNDAMLGYVTGVIASGHVTKPEEDYA